MNDEQPRRKVRVDLQELRFAIEERLTSTAISSTPKRVT